MRIAIIGSRNLTINNLEDYMPREVTEIVSGGAVGVDSSAREYAERNNIKLTEFLPKYSEFGRSAPLKRNLQIIEYCDCVMAFWDGKSRGTKFTIDNAIKIKKKVTVLIYKNGTFEKML